MKSMIKNALALTLLMSVPVVFAADVNDLGFAIQSCGYAQDEQDRSEALLGEEPRIATPASDEAEISSGFSDTAKASIQKSLDSAELVRTAGKFEPSSRSGRRTMRVREFQTPYDMESDYVDQMRSFESSSNFSEAAGDFPQPAIVAPVASDARWFGGLRDGVSNVWNRASYANMKDGVVGYYNNTTRGQKALDTAKVGAAAVVAYGAYKGGQHLYNKYVKTTTKSTTPVVVAIADSAPVLAPKPVQRAVEAVKAAPANVKRIAKKAVKRGKQVVRRGKKAVKRTTRNVRRNVANRRAAKVVVVRRSR